MSDDEYNRLCREIDESEEAEYEEFKREMGALGVVLCLFDGLGCNMAFACKDGRVLCAVSSSNSLKGLDVYVCGRLAFNGGQGWALSVYSKVLKQGVLGACRRKRSELCFFDKKRCGHSDVGSKAFPNGCVFEATDKSGFGSKFYCGRIQFKGGMSISEKVSRQRLLEKREV